MMNKKKKVLFVILEGVSDELFYLSQNLEHVVFDRLNVSSKEKTKNMVRYLKRVQGTADIETLLESLLPAINDNSNNQHKNSWDFIMEDDHSLQRCANVVLMYEFIIEITALSVDS